MNLRMTVTLVLGAVLLLCTGVASADAGAQLSSGDVEFLNSLLDIINAFIESLEGLLSETAE